MISHPSHSTTPSPNAPVSAPHRRLPSRVWRPAADVVINFRTSFYDDDHQIVLSAKVVARRYSEGWFVWDLVATLPYHIIGTLATIGAPSETRMLVVGLCKIPVCMRLPRLTHKLDEISSVGYFRVVLQVRTRNTHTPIPWPPPVPSACAQRATTNRVPLLRPPRQMFGFIMVAHWVACIWWMIGEGAYDLDADEAGGTSWLRRVPPGSTELYTNVTITPFAQQVCAASSSATAEATD